MDTESKLKRGSRKEILKKIESLIAKIRYLRITQLKFNPDYLSRINSRKLEILALSVFRQPFNIVKMSERERRLLFKRILKAMKLRAWTYEELMTMMVALGYPRPKPVKLKIEFRKAVNKLVIQLRRDIKSKIIYTDELLK